MRPTLAFVLIAGLALFAVPATAGPPQGKPATAGPKTLKAGGPKTPGPKSVIPANSVKSPKAAKAPNAAKAAGAKSGVPKNPKLVARLEGMLPSGMTVEQAANGFKNQGNFIAAVNAAHNHDISFVDLKKRIVDGELSLGQALHELKPGLDSDVEATRATQWAEDQLEPR